jgi:arylsulfatase A-like enzyme/Flp pilus assembly protein TadD
MASAGTYNREVVPAPEDATLMRALTGRSVVRGCAVAALAGLGAGISGGGPEAAPRESGRSVLLVTIDTLRADALGAYGHESAITPWIDRLARKGVRFDRARAHNVVTLPSHANILSGRLPLEHGVRDNSGFRFPAELPTLATLLRERGYRTGAFVSAFPLDSRFGLARGFDVYEDSFVSVDAGGAFSVQERPGPETVALASDWIRRAGAEPYFCWVHLFEPHHPYRPPPGIASRVEDPYAAEVSAADAALGPLLASLLERGASARTVVVLTSDHGESLGEHGEQTHGLFAYEGTLRVPLILWAPGLLEPRAVASPARHVDVLPTILDALGVGAPKVAGSSLLPAARGRSAEPVPSYFESLSPALNRGWAPLYGVVRGERKYVDLPVPELYDLGADPEEADNLFGTGAGEVEALRRLLGTYRARDVGIRRPGATVDDPETRARLEALGYLSHPAGPLERTYSEDDDPKNLIGIDAMLHELAALHGKGDLDGAIALCREIVRRRPGMPLGVSRLSYLLRQKGDLAGAIEVLQAGLEREPDDVDLVAVLGAYLNEAGRSGEAARLLAVYAEAASPEFDVLNAYGVALAGAGRPRDALDAFRRALDVDPSDAMTHVNMATVHLMGRDHERARRELQTALEINPRLARAHNGLGVIASREGRLDDALAHWKRAVELDPAEFDTLFNVGSQLLRSGKHAEARPYLERFVREAPPALYAPDIATVRGWLERMSRSERPTG